MSLSQEGHEIRLDIDEVEVLLTTAKKMAKNYEKTVHGSVYGYNNFLNTYER